MPVRRSLRFRSSVLAWKALPATVPRAASDVTTQTVAALMLIGLFGGCAVGPDYSRPAVAIPAAYKEAAPGWKVAEPSDRTDRGEWWTVFGDASLNQLETKVNVSNQTIATFEAAYRQARALVSQARSAYFPIVGISAVGSRSGSGGSALLNSGGAVSSVNTGGISSHYTLQGDASWEPDIWGRVRREVASEKAGQQAAEADLANARLSAQATLAQDYFQLRALDATQKLLDNTVVAYQKSLELTQNRYRQGVAARSDVLQAQTQLQSAQASAVNNGIARAQFEHAIAVLVGEPPSTFSIPVMPLAEQPPPLPVQLPTVLLERRPDVAAAERRAAAANEQIGVAIAAYFPTVSLSATGGYQSSLLSDLLTTPARFWTVGPQFAATLFDAGLRGAQTDAARAIYDQQVATYRQTVLSAFQEVEDNLVSLRVLENEIGIQEQAVQSAQQALEIVINQYKAGTTTYLTVITSQTAAYTAEQTLTNIAGQRMVSAVGLVKALGGGWDVQEMNGEPPAAGAAKAVAAPAS
ncbi:efflux transporter outer membrane subunit [Pararobbsia alpina]|uniref:Outer membrane protein OprM n=1 Tax=Pararobbsia alpina TaxID=621374 RepID=A0A6S7AVH2_9BURK|nr:efflux transporter outer membrane subunit [Pararobbsia alpina]CAB3778871.1 Outer membrane protein OprM [Pararobbsia alpina]